MNSTLSEDALKSQKLCLNDEKPFKAPIVWRNVFLMTLLHMCALYGVWLTLISAKWQTIFAMYFFGISSAIGVLAGAHRLWSHRSYKAKWQLRVCFDSSRKPLSNSSDDYGFAIFKFSAQLQSYWDISYTSLSIDDVIKLY